MKNAVLVAKSSIWSDAEGCMDSMSQAWADVRIARSWRFGKLELSLYDSLASISGLVFISSNDDFDIATMLQDTTNNSAGNFFHSKHENNHLPMIALLDMYKKWKIQETVATWGREKGYSG